MFACTVVRLRRHESRRGARIGRERRERRSGFSHQPEMFGPELSRARGAPPAWALRGMRHRGTRRAATLVLALAGVALLVLVSGVRFARQEIGYVGVVRNGGPLDKRTVRQILLPGQRLTWTGFFSESPHEYPAATVNRTYTVTSDTTRGSRPGVDVVQVPTEDGVLIGVEATVFLRFVGESDLDTLIRFETSYGSRQFPAPDGKLLYPWEGDAGFYAWLDQYFRPVLDYNLRQEVSRYSCAEIVASCSLVTRGTGVAPVPLAKTEALAAHISRDLEADFTRTVGQPYLHDIRMRISRVTLPGVVQREVDKAQAAFTAVNRARAELKTARYEAAQKRLLGRAYNQSPALANIDALKSLPDKSTVIFNGSRPLVVAGG